MLWTIKTLVHHGQEVSHRVENPPPLASKNVKTFSLPHEAIHTGFKDTQLARQCSESKLEQNLEHAYLNDNDHWPGLQVQVHTTFV